MLRLLYLPATVAAFLLGASPAFARGTEGACACASHQAAGVKEASPSLADKCSCSGASDCTCKKGECKCPKCGAHKRKLIDSLRGKASPLTIPATSRRDASAGFFI